MMGLYFHVPFCDGKCPYCDFYSLRAEEEQMDRYLRRMEELLSDSGTGEPVGTVYFGGGTPNLLGADRLAALLNQASRAFSVQPGAEITAEANPTHVDRAFFEALAKAGFNRLSMGLQSANEEELRLLGRRHTPQDAAEAVEAARAAGFRNISLDLMLGLPGGSEDKLRRSIEFAAALDVEHISSYLLKVEEGTPFAAGGIQALEEDEAADQYLFCVEELEKHGYLQYEISNFAKPGRESRHNLVYWHGEEYLGFGPGAHSFYRGKRFYYPRSLAAFLKGEQPLPDGEGGGLEEFAMLNLRLTEGLRKSDCEKRFGAAGRAAFEKMEERAALCPAGLVKLDGKRIALTPEGFLVSNALLLRLLEE